MQILLIIGLGCLVFGSFAHDKSTGTSLKDIFIGNVLYAIGFGTISAYLYIEYNFLFVSGMLATLSIQNTIKIVKRFLDSL